MSTDLSTHALLRRIAQLEAAVGRLSADLGSLRSVAPRQWRQVATPRGCGRPVHSEGAIAASSQIPGAAGLAGAVARGEAARVQWVKEGLVVPGEKLAHA